MNLLAIDSSILADYSVSRHLLNLYLDNWQRAYPQSEIIYRDLHAQAISHFNGELLGAKQKTAEELSSSLKSELELSEQLLMEFLNADEVVLGVPMYNFTIPTQLKSWIDRILVAGRTFKYTEQGVIGLAAGKKVTLISTRGNHYSSDAVMQAKDHQEQYLKTIFDFIGIKEVNIIRAEGLHLGETIKSKALALAEQEIKSTFREVA